MHIRPMTEADLDDLADIDGTIESLRYLHLEREGEGVASSFRLDERPLRSKLIEANAISDDLRFELRQVVGGADEGLALVAEHDQALCAMLLARADAESQTLRLIDLRVDYDARRQGLAMAMLFEAINQARRFGLRAVAFEAKTNNLPANLLLQRCGFELAGVDTHRDSNHDLVKESVTLFWYASLD